MWFDSEPTKSILPESDDLTPLYFTGSTNREDELFVSLARPGYQHQEASLLPLDCQRQPVRGIHCAHAHCIGSWA